MRPSKQALDLLKKHNLDRRELISWQPRDLPGCECEAGIKQRVFKHDLSFYQCPKVSKLRDKGYIRYKVICTKCGEILATFWNNHPSLDQGYCDLHEINWHDKKSWHGCLGLNRNPKTLEINFECACGNKVISEPSLNNMLRYTKYKILKY